MNAPKKKPQNRANGSKGSSKNSLGDDRIAILASKSTATEHQRERALEALRLRPHTSYELRCLGLYQAPARIKELRDEFGYDIETQRVTLVDRDGFSHPRAALYCLRGEPEGTA